MRGRAPAPRIHLQVEAFPCLTLRTKLATHSRIAQATGMVGQPEGPRAIAESSRFRVRRLQPPPRGVETAESRRHVCRLRLQSHLSSHVLFLSFLVCAAKLYRRRRSFGSSLGRKVLAPVDLSDAAGASRHGRFAPSIRPVYSPPFLPTRRCPGDRWPWLHVERAEPLLTVASPLRSGKDGSASGRWRAEEHDFQLPHL